MDTQPQSLPWTGPPLAARHEPHAERTARRGHTCGARGAMAMFCAGLAARSAEAAGLRGGAGRRGRGRNGAQSAAAKPHGARAPHGYGH
eukprot:1348689-Prymnesium_polylepis.1